MAIRAPDGANKAFYGFHGYMDVWLLGNVVLWLIGNMAALQKVAQCHIQESLLSVFCELISLSAHIPIAVYQEVSAS